MTAPRVSIRPFDLSADLDACVDIWSRAAKRAHPFLDGEGEGERRDRLRDIYFPNAESYIAEADGAIAGFISLMPGPSGVTEIGGVFVDPDRQGGGVGRRLIEHAAALKGALTLEVFVLNEASRGFYRRVGFVEGAHRVYEESGHMLVRCDRPARPVEILA
ncbi:MAG: GNAT family N-acetyltransferase [Pseudomonadota bacterium]